MSAHSQFRRKVRVALVGLMAAALPLAARASSIGLYTDETGSSCSFSGNSPGIITAHVMIRPDERGLHAVRFSAPIPSCLGAVFVDESEPADVVLIGNSQEGISAAFGTCATSPRRILQVRYYRSGATGSCCEFPIEADPFVGVIEGVDCNHQSLVVDPVVSHFNADQSCACTQPANLAPLVPSQPAPADNRTSTPLWSQLRWQSADPEGQSLTYDVYFGDQNPPPLLASDLWNNGYDVVGLSYATQYYWRVVARDALGLESEGPVWTFTTMLNPPPGVPRNPSPAMEASNRPLDTRLAWSCWEPDGEALAFDVYFGTSESPPLVATNVATPGYDPGPLVLSTVYYWRIVARDPHGGETAGPTWTFSSVAVSSFSVVASSQGVDVRWRLATDQGMDSYTLFRTEQQSGTTVTLAQGVVTALAGSYFDDTVEPAKRYAYELSVRSDSGDDFRSSAARVTTKNPELELSANHPNPFNPQTTIPYFLTYNGHVTLAIYDSAGRLVRTLVNSAQDWGAHSVVWDGTNDSGAVAASGVYFARLQDVNGNVRVRKLVMLK